MMHTGPAKLVLLDHADPLAVIPATHGGSEARRAATNHTQIKVSHAHTLLPGELALYTPMPTAQASEEERKA